MLNLTHRVSLADAHGHLLGVETLVESDQPLPNPLVVLMPVWTPGSYLVREHARHVERLRASASGKPLSVRKVRKNAWAIEHAGVSRIAVCYDLYANDLSVRTNHVDSTHAYWNGAATYLAVEGVVDLGAHVVVIMPQDWAIATPLPALDSNGAPGHATSPRRYVAKTFDELCDAPFECGPLLDRAFVTLGKRHRLAAWATPDAHLVDWDRLCNDTRTIVETEAKLLAGKDSDPASQLPYDEYLFLWHVTQRGRGGLEHEHACTLMARGQSFATRVGYLDALSLVAHEFFHLWNVKRIRPEGLSPYRYEEENYTRALWWFEGATSYYDWRILVLAGLATPVEYLEHLAGEIARLEDTPGAALHPLEEASFDAWIKAYRPDENTPNSTVSYYLKGELVCALFDLEIRRRTQGRASLDDVVRHLWRNYGSRRVPVPESGLPDLFAEAVGLRLDDRFEAWVRGTAPLPIEEMLASAGLAIDRRLPRDAPRVSLGIRARVDGGRAIVETVVRGRAGHRAGMDARDEILGIADRRIADGRLESALQGLAPGDRVAVLVARDGWIKTLHADLDATPANDLRIAPKEDASPEQRDLYESWMGQPF